MAGSIVISESPFSPSALLEQFTRDCDGAGAISSFTGLVRADENTQTLTLTHYEGFTQQVIKTFADTAESRWNILKYAIYHRIGDMNIAAPIVFVAVASAHRRDAFEACDYLMDCLKTEAPFWKQEKSHGHSAWIEPRAADYADKTRWSA